MNSIQVPAVFKPLVPPMRYKAAIGGRGSGKSHFFCMMIVLRCLQAPTRVVCLREIQLSIRDSVRALLINKIAELGVEEQFTVLDAEIRGKNGSLITFMGMKSTNAHNVKSLEGVDIAFVEEAQALSQHSLDILRPTIRKPGSELWFAMNPLNPTDAVDAFFRKNPPANAIHVVANWNHNPFLPKELLAEKDHDYATDPEGANWIWGGQYASGKGTILARWINQAEREGRIHDEVEFDPHGAPVHISMDLGFRDTTCAFFWQPKIGGFSVFSYLHGVGLDAEDWIVEIQKELTARGVTAEKLGKIWLPQDAKAKTFQSKHTSAEKFLSAFGRGAVEIIPPSKKSDQISAARSVITRVEFHKTRCEDGIDGLRAWKYAYNETDQVFSRDPKHDFASHRGDAFAYGCQVLAEQKHSAKRSTFQPRIVIGGQGTATLDDLWSTQPKSHRI